MFPALQRLLKRSTVAAERDRREPASKSLAQDRERSWEHRAQRTFSNRLRWELHPGLVEGKTMESPPEDMLKLCDCLVMPAVSVDDVPNRSLNPREHEPEERSEKDQVHVLPEGEAQSSMYTLLRAPWEERSGLRRPCPLARGPAAVSARVLESSTESGK